jgi:hypothetical protein
MIREIEELPLVNRTLIRVTPILTYEFAEIRHRLIAMAAMQESEPTRRKSLIHELDRSIKVLGSNRLPPISAATRLLAEAQRARLTGDEDLCVAKLRQGIDAMKSLESVLYVRAAEFQLGRVLGGDEGAAMTAAAHRALTDKTVVNPARYANCLVPMY